MFKMMVDTCAWLDVAIDPEAELVISKIEQLIEDEKLAVLVPDIVLDEFARNRKDYEDRIIRRIGTHLKHAKEVVEKHAEAECRLGAIKGLESVITGLPKMRDTIATSIRSIEGILEHPTTEHPPITDGVKQLATQRGLEKLAPFVSNKNSTADAVLIEVFRACVSSRSCDAESFSFVTTNKNDFSSPQDFRIPHPDFASIFDAKN